MNPLQMMKQAQQLQERLQKEMATISVEGASGGGMVTAIVNVWPPVPGTTVRPRSPTW